MTLACPRTARCSVLLVMVLFIAGCGGGGGGGGSTTGPAVNPNAPVLSDFQVVALDPERANTRVRYAFGANFVDVPGDVFNGTCELSTSVGPVSQPINVLLPGASPNATQGSVVCIFFFLVPSPTQVTGTFTVVDRAGNRSNSFSFVLGISERRSGEAAPGGTGGAAVGAESGSLGRRR